MDHYLFCFRQGCRLFKRYVHVLCYHDDILNFDIVFSDPEPGRNIRNIQMERARLFASGRTSTSVSSKVKKRNQEPGQHILFVLQTETKNKVPTSLEREILFKAGLGYKRIPLSEEDKEDDMMEKLTNESNFYQLKNIDVLDFTDFIWI